MFKNIINFVANNFGLTRYILIIFILILLNLKLFGQSNEEIASGYYPCNELYNGIWENNSIKSYELIEKSKTIDTVLYLFKDSLKNYCIPAKGKFLSPYGPRGSRNHSGIDIKLNLGDSVYCAFDGVVRVAKVMSGYGYVVVVRHYNGLETLYSHLSKMLVNIDQEIKAGEVLGLGGRTGRATTTHLHFETRFLTRAFNPSELISLETYELLSDSIQISCKTFKSCIDNNDNSDDDHDENIDLLASNLKNNPYYHTINKGDTLYNIAKRNNTTIENICELNNINRNKTLNIGTKLRVK